MKELLFIALFLACPLMMIWMMRGDARGGHVHGHGVGSGAGHSDASHEPKSLPELRRQRDELDRLIAEETRARSGSPPIASSHTGGRSDRPLPTEPGLEQTFDRVGPYSPAR